MTDHHYTGGCHCGAVKFEILLDHLPDSLPACNCSICQKTGYLHLFVTRDQFRLLSGEDNLENYQFGSKTASHFFCNTCGIKSFYIPRSHPDGFSVHAGCLDNFDLSAIPIVPFDGRNWEKNVESIR